jgi:nucleoside-diphosphate-sugar epimerase
VTFTIFGGHGFIGSHLAAELRRRGVEPSLPSRDDASWRHRPLGHVIYAAGTTGDFRHRRLDTVRAHVCRFAELVEHGGFDSLLYLSSTRLYGGADGGGEASRFRVDPGCPGDVYNLSKLMGEALALGVDRPHVRVVRLSNVYGPDWASPNFLLGAIRDAVDRGAITFGTSGRSSRDYVSIEDTVDLLLAIAERGRQRLYNVAAGAPVTNDELAAALRDATGCATAFAAGAPTVAFPRIDIARIRGEFGAAPRRLVDDLPRLVAGYRTWRSRDPR